MNGDIIIESVEIISTGRGCHGHPKTISALVKNIPISSIDVDTLSIAECVHETSCGMVLADCIKKNKNSY